MWKRTTRPSVLSPRGIDIALKLVFHSGLSIPHQKLSDAAEGLHYIDSRNVVHAGRVLIAQFGFATAGGSVEEGLDEIKYRTRFYAPEVSNGEEADKQADSFSFAMLSIEASQPDDVPTPPMVLAHHCFGSVQVSPT